MDKPNYSCIKCGYDHIMTFSDSQLFRAFCMKNIELKIESVDHPFVFYSGKYKLENHYIESQKASSNISYYLVQGKIRRNQCNQYIRINEFASSNVTFTKINSEQFIR